MDTQSNYKRTVTGSVGAGMGAIFNGSGRTYYILEHKTSSSYHQAGESQKIIIDQIEIGRDASCQVRFDDSFETVSRRHAAIVRDGQDWKLIHLSTSNPTLVNGQAVSGTYFLNSGDEIQLSVGGPRLGFIIPQGKQALTSSIRLTERMNLFRQQALKPYKRAIGALALLLLLVIIGFGIWNYKLGNENQKLLAQAEQLFQQNQELDKQIEGLEKKIQENPENAELRQQMEELKKQKNQVQTRYTTIYRTDPQLQQKIDEMEKHYPPTNIVDSPEKGNTSKGNTVIETEKEESSISDVAQDGAQDDIQRYYPDIYTLKIEKITVEYSGKSADPGIATSNLVVGTGFVQNGYFVTARSNIEPWMYYEYIKDDWRYELAKYAAHGCKIIINFAAYSTRGTSHPIRFSSEQFSINRSGDVDVPITITKEFYVHAEVLGFPFTWKVYKKKHMTAHVYSTSSHNVATIHVGGSGIPVDKVMSSKLKGGENITIAGYQGHQSQHSLGDATYFTTATSSVASYFITLQSATSSWGYVGSPAFYKGEDGKYRVVGVYVGNFNGECHLVPMNRVR